jgi:hypothetical protein
MMSQKSKDLTAWRVDCLRNTDTDTDDIKQAYEQLN